MPERQEKDRFNELMGHFLDDSITEVQLQELTALVKENPEFSKELRTQLLMDTWLSQYENESHGAHAVQRLAAVARVRGFERWRRDVGEKRQLHRKALKVLTLACVPGTTRALQNTMKLMMMFRDISSCTYGKEGLRSLHPRRSKTPKQHPLPYPCCQPLPSTRSRRGGETWHVQVSNRFRVLPSLRRVLLCQDIPLNTYACGISCSFPYTSSFPRGDLAKPFTIRNGFSKFPAGMKDYHPSL